MQFGNLYVSTVDINNNVVSYRPTIHSNSVLCKYFQNEITDAIFRNDSKSLCNTKA